MALIFCSQNSGAVEECRHRSKMKAIFAFYCALALAAQPNPGKTGEALFDKAKQRYYDAVEGEQGALDESRDLLSELRSRNPDDAILQAYYGSARLLEAARAFAPWRKGSLAKEGLRMLDEAVGKAPGDLEVRFLRAVSTWHLPGFFKRGEQSRRDFAWLAPQIAEAVESGVLDKRLGAAALYHHGLALDGANDRTGALSAWREAARVGPETRAGNDAERKLEEGQR